MANLKKEEKARRDGMAYAYKIAKEKGFDALEEEINRRNIPDIPILICKEELDEMILGLKSKLIDTLTILSMITLYDEFDFNQDQLIEYMNRYVLKSECISLDYTSWEEQIKILGEECGVHLIKDNNGNIRLDVD